MERLLKILLMFLKSKYIFGIPKDKKLVIFDDTSFNEIKHIFKDFEHIIIQTRLNNINKIYISLSLIFNVIKNYKGNLLTAYIISLIKIIRPKVVFTFIDNSYKFFEVAKALNKNIKFVALQNGARYEILENHYLFKKKLIKKNLNKFFFLPKLLCFGNYEIITYKKYKIRVKKFKKVGYIRLENYLKHHKKISKKKLKKKYDICLLSDVGAWNKMMNTENLKSKFALLAKYCIRFSIQHNKKIVLVFKRKKVSDDNSFNEEQNLYKKFLTKNEYEYLRKGFLFKRDGDRFRTYRVMNQSKVVVGTMSTLLRENIVMGGKTLSCNMTKNRIYNFPIKGKFFIECEKYLDFEKKFLQILHVSEKCYLKGINSKQLISNLNTSDLVIEELKKLINT